MVWSISLSCRRDSATCGEHVQEFTRCRAQNILAQDLRNGHLELSQKRADTVMQFMIAQGVKPSLVSAQGFGEKDPVASNDTPRDGRRTGAWN